MFINLSLIFYFSYNSNEQSTYPSDAERYYNHIHLLFLEQNPDAKSFDLYRPSWEYLKDSAKFARISLAHQAVKRSNNSNSEEDLITPTPKNPVGKKKAKRMVEEQKMVENVLAEFKKSSNNNNAGEALANALNKFADICFSGLHEWKDRSAYANADAQLCQRYDDLVLQTCIQALERTVIQSCSELPNNNCDVNSSNSDDEQDNDPTACQAYSW